MAAGGGDLLCPLDCDDALEAAYLEKTVAALERNPEAGFAFSHLRLTGQKDGILAENYNFFAQLFLNQLPYCLLLRREVWEALDGYDESMRQGYEDWEFNIRAGASGYHGVCVAESLFRYRVSDEGMLKGVSNRLHAELWHAIQERNPELFHPGALFATWRRWRDRPLPYPALLLMGLWAAHRLMPSAAFNRVFRSLMQHSASAQISVPESA